MQTTKMNNGVDKKGKRSSNNKGDARQIEKKSGCGRHHTNGSQLLP